MNDNHTDPVDKTKLCCSRALNGVCPVHRVGTLLTSAPIIIEQPAPATTRALALPAKTAGPKPRKSRGRKK